MKKQSNTSNDLSKDKAKTPQKTTDVKSPPSQLQLNLAHLLFLHGLVNKFYELDDVDNQMKDFLHDLLIMFEIYIEQVPNEKLFEKFNYEPINNK